MNMLKTLTIATSSGLLLAACATSPKLSDNTALSKAPISKPDTRTVATVSAPSNDSLNDPKGILAKRSVYFDYDNYALKQEFKPLITAHAKYLTNNNARKIVIQGNTDDRGGSEYNLALGQKRADTVRNTMALLGVHNIQMEAVSFGKEKPRALGDDEASWAENRRADVVYDDKVTR